MKIDQFKRLFIILLIPLLLLGCFLAANSKVDIYRDFISCNTVFCSKSNGNLNREEGVKIEDFAIIYDENIYQNHVKIYSTTMEKYKDIIGKVVKIDVFRYDNNYYSSMNIRENYGNILFDLSHGGEVHGEFIVDKEKKELVKIIEEARHLNKDIEFKNKAIDLVNLLAPVFFIILPVVVFLLGSALVFFVVNGFKKAYRYVVGN